MPGRERAARARKCAGRKTARVAKLANQQQNGYTKNLLPAQNAAQGRPRHFPSGFRFFRNPQPQEEFMLVIHARRHIGAQEAMPS